jgi:FKBP-type peptidyl-prolyl cis-trans isomerase (trigger factor)
VLTDERTTVKDNLLSFYGRVDANRFREAIEARLRESIRREKTPKGFRPGAAAEAENRRRLLPKVTRELMIGIVEPRIAAFAETKGIVVFREGSLDISSSEGPDEIEIMVAVPVWTPFQIDLSPVTSFIRAQPALSADDSGRTSAVLSALKATHDITLDYLTIRHYAQLVGKKLGESKVADSAFKEELTNTLLLDSLAVALNVQPSEEDLAAHITHLAVTSGLSLIEVRKSIQLLGGQAVLRQEVRRKLAVSRCLSLVKES